MTRDDVVAWLMAHPAEAWSLYPPIAGPWYLRDASWCREEWRGGGKFPLTIVYQKVDGAWRWDGDTYPSLDDARAAADAALRLRGWVLA